MLTSDAGQLEVVELEAWLDAECPCEMKHRYTTCSQIVVAIVLSCEERTRVCQNAMAFKMQEIASGEVACKWCKRRVENCWRIIPI